MATKKTEIKEKKAKKKIFKSPSAFAVLFVIIALMAGLTWLIPSGRLWGLGTGKPAAASRQRA